MYDYKDGRPLTPQKIQSVLRKVSVLSLHRYPERVEIDRESGKRHPLSPRAKVTLYPASSIIRNPSAEQVAANDAKIADNFGRFRARVFAALALANIVVVDQADDNTYVLAFGPSLLDICPRCKGGDEIEKWVNCTKCYGGYLWIDDPSVKLARDAAVGRAAACIS